MAQPENQHIQKMKTILDTVKKCDTNEQWHHLKPEMQSAMVGLAMQQNVGLMKEAYSIFCMICEIQMTLSKEKSIILKAIQDELKQDYLKMIKEAQEKQ